jgi:hypothetical protein
MCAYMLHLDVLKHGTVRLTVALPICSHPQPLSPPCLTRTTPHSDSRRLARGAATHRMLGPSFPPPDAFRLYICAKDLSPTISLWPWGTLFAPSATVGWRRSGCPLSSSRSLSSGRSSLCCFQSRRSSADSRRPRRCRDLRRRRGRGCKGGTVSRGWTAKRCPGDRAEPAGTRLTPEKPDSVVAIRPSFILEFVRSSLRPSVLSFVRSSPKFPTM